MLLEAHNRIISEIVREKRIESQDETNHIQEFTINGFYIVQSALSRQELEISFHL